MPKKIEPVGKLDLSLAPAQLRILGRIAVKCESCERCEGCQSCQTCEGCQSCQTSMIAFLAKDNIVYELVEDAEKKPVSSVKKSNVKAARVVKRK